MVPEVVDEAELAILDAELDELELVDIVVGESFQLVVEGDTWGFSKFWGPKYLNPKCYTIVRI